MSKLSRRGFSATALAAGLAGCAGPNAPSRPKNVLFLAVGDLRPARKWKDGAYSQYPRGAKRMGYSVRSR